MAKKSFKDNPATQFISAPSEELQQQPPENADSKLPSSEQHTEIPPRGYKHNPRFIETKSRRVQLVLQPSLYDKVKAKAQKSKISINEYIHQLLEADTKEG